MIREPTDEEIQAFDRLARMAARLHELTWCVKIQGSRFTANLRGRECLRCDQNVLQGGICDPL